MTDEPPAGSAYDAAPDIETIDVPETAVAMADDLDIPELAYEEDEPAGQAFDDIDADFAAAYGETGPSEEPASQPVKGGGRDGGRLRVPLSVQRRLSGVERLFRGRRRPPTPSLRPPLPTSTTARHSTVSKSRRRRPLSPGDRDRFVDLDFDSDVDEEMTVPAYAPQERVAPQQRRGMMIAAIVGGVALLGGVGALALSFGNGEGADVPVVVKADDGPVKVKPENPGGTTVPNQDNKVYDAVKGASGTEHRACPGKAGDDLRRAGRHGRRRQGRYDGTARSRRRARHHPESRGSGRSACRRRSEHERAGSA